MNVRGRLAGAFVSTVLLVTGCSTQTSTLRPAANAEARQYLVFYTGGGRPATLRAVAAAGGTLEGQDARLGYLLVKTASPERLGAEPSVVGVTLNRRIGTAVSVPASVPMAGSVSRPASVAAHAGGARAGGGDPLSGRQWDMKLIGATPDGSYAKARGSHKVLVGIIDTGIDGRHPDIAPNFNRELSRNFVTDRPKDSNARTFDGKCEHKGCKDPVDEDDDGHGTHVASTIGSPLNGIGVAGVAPNVSLVNLRAGTDSGFFFLKPTMDALTYAGDVGVDVVNMSFYVDPWTYNCAANPEDSPAEQLEQRGVLEGMRRALDYARARGVTLITAIGNSGTDLGAPKKDVASPDYPLGSERDRTVDNSCLNVPTELDGVISVSAVGPSGRKASYSDYGIEQTDIAAPGGDSLDSAARMKGIRREILAAAPLKVLREQKLVDKHGKPDSSSAVRDCHRGKCSYYQYLEGSSMAAPHATGVAAIIISRFGKPGKGGLYMDPAQVERLLYASAVKKGCPSPRAYKYGKSDVQTCDGDKERNGFYGHGIVSAIHAATITP